MKQIICFVILLALSRAASSQESTLLTSNINPTPFQDIPLSLFAGEDNENAMSNFALSINPLGFAQFGPLINAEVGLTDNLILNLHVRVPFLGLLTYVINAHNDGLDELFGIAGGGGPIYFFGTNKSKPYAGILLEYDHLRKLYAKDEPWEWEQTDNSVVFAINGGYRFRFNGGFFINTGAFLGAAVSFYNWEYSDSSYGEFDNTSRDGTNITPFGMVEVAFGIEF